MNVYQFDYDVDYGTGISLIAAPDESTAREIAETLDYEFGRWEFGGIFNGLTYDTTEPQIIMELTYAN